MYRSSDPVARRCPWSAAGPASAAWTAGVASRSKRQARRKSGFYLLYEENYQKPPCETTFEELPFPTIFICCLLPSSHPMIKKLFIMGGWVKRWIYLVTKWAEQAANGAIGMPQGQKPLGLIYFWRVPFSHFQPLMLPSFLFPQN